MAAYHHKSDHFLILDVSRYKYSPVWVKADKLWESMLTIDSVSNTTSGFAIVTKVFSEFLKDS
ncbi:phytochelatin synthase family protein [Geminocystis sp. GBBB08]|uniref:phytochelatin synthase family protein n=1 Tax=Geminocystis sp. GBBB08 TaxID=2604140 RepID=UPI0027E34C19|nr:phytochelatin synthase family protein [Geminocystis sp. GBBB08]